MTDFITSDAHDSMSITAETAEAAAQAFVDGGDWNGAEVIRVLVRTAAAVAEDGDLAVGETFTLDVEQVNEANFTCENDRYCQDTETFTSVEDFQAMCLACFGVEADLRHCGDDYYDADTGLLVLRAI